MRPVGPVLPDVSQLLADAARDGLVAVDDAGVVVAANEAAGRMLGRGREALAGVPLADALPARTATRLAAVLARLGPEPERLVARRATGAAPSPIVVRRLDGAGPVAAVVVFFSAADPLEDALQRIARDFIRNAAHQLRTPLTAIASAVDVLRHGAHEDPAIFDRFLSHVALHTERLTRLTRGLLVLARAQSGEPLRLDLVELRPLLHLLAHEAEPQPGVEIVVEPASRVVAVAEDDLLHEALAALVDNAVTHTSRGRIRLRAWEDEGSAFVEVADTGSGILPEHRERLTEVFFRGSQTGPGFGLGLAIAAEALEAMGGELSLAPGGNGATFVARLPSAGATA